MREKLRKALLPLTTLFSTCAGVITLIIDAVAKTQAQCGVQCMLPPSDARLWAGGILILGPWILISIRNYLRNPANTEEETENGGVA